jgi:hypothetical protein
MSSIAQRFSFRHKHPVLVGVIFLRAIKSSNSSTLVAVLTTNSSDLRHVLSVATDGNTALGGNPALQLWIHCGKTTATFGHSSLSR